MTGSLMLILRKSGNSRLPESIAPANRALMPTAQLQTPLNAGRFPFDSGEFFVVRRRVQSSDNSIETQSIVMGLSSADGVTIGSTRIPGVARGKSGQEAGRAVL